MFVNLYHTWMSLHTQALSLLDSCELIQAETIVYVALLSNLQTKTQGEKNWHLNLLSAKIKGLHILCFCTIESTSHLQR